MRLQATLTQFDLQADRPYVKRASLGISIAKPFILSIVAPDGGSCVHVTLKKDFLVALCVCLL